MFTLTNYGKAATAENGHMNGHKAELKTELRQELQNGTRTTIPPPADLLSSPFVPERKLFGPGPTNMTANVQHSMQLPILSHLHVEFHKILDTVREGVKYLFQTRNTLTFVVSGSGNAGMECALLNLLETGEKLLVIRNGMWGERCAEVGRRMQLNMRIMAVEDGEVVQLEDFKRELREFRPKVVFLCQGESSTGVLHPLEGFGPACHEVGALLLVDVVASIGGAEFHADDLEVDCVYAATQKAINAPPGLAPISFSDRAVAAIRERRTRPMSFYFDALELGNYWGCDGAPRRYHHTAFVMLVYALREALANVAREGVDESVRRHRRNAQLLYRLLDEHGFQLFVEDERLRLPCLTTVRVPPNTDWRAVQERLMAQGYEIAGGLGPTTGKVWRIGTFGVNSDPRRFGVVPKMMREAMTRDASKM